jgi:hypothetical protein
MQISSPDHRSDDSALKRALAALIAGTRTTKRPCSLIEVAKWLEVAREGLGSYATIADRIGISEKMLRQFSYVGRLTEDVKHLFDTRRLDSVDAATHLAMLPAGDQVVVAHDLAEKLIDTADVRAVVQLRKAGAKQGIKSLLARVRRSKTKKHFIAEFVIRGDGSRDRVLKAFGTYIEPREIVDLQVDGVLGRITLTDEGRRQLRSTARAMGVPLKHTIPEILSAAM